MSAATPKKREWPVIRVFVSSTFTDFKHERYALHQNVFRKLELHCATRGFQFQSIDLRWGVPMEAALDHRTMQICFEELRRSQQISPQPNFLILLGNRYGWRPLSEVISAEEFGRLLTTAIDNHNDYYDRLATEILRQWYVQDENSRPAQTAPGCGDYLLMSRLSTFKNDKRD